jgi:DNA-binding transcriptional LysR family regulator
MSRVTLRRLEVFIAVVETGGFASAAHRLGISQPSVSAHIKALEDDSHGVLFERRHGQRVTLTSRGAAFRVHAQRMLAEAKEMRAPPSGRRHKSQSRIVFGCQNAIASFLLASQLAQFVGSSEDLELVVRTGAQKDILAQVRSGLADVGYILSNSEPRGLASTVVGHQRLIFVAAPSHPLAKRKRLAIADLRNHNFVGKPSDSSFVRELDSVLVSLGLEERRVVAETPECAILREMVIDGVGIALFPAGGVSRSLEAGTLVALNVDAPELQIDVRQILSRSAGRSPRVDMFVEFLNAREPGES